MTLDESWLAVVGYSGVLSVYPVDKGTGAVGQATATLTSDPATGVAFSASGGQIVASSSNDDVVRVYNFDAASSTLAAPAAREFPIFRDPSRIAVADLNEDGIVSTV
jgi:DNA-binding beta-propeller fold protein YncE